MRSWSRQVTTGKGIAFAATEEENGEEDDDLVVEMVNLLKLKGFINKKFVKKCLDAFSL